MRQIILNALIDQSRRANYFEAFVNTQEEEVFESDQQMRWKCDEEILSEAIEQLEPLPKLYVLQRFFMGKPNREICEEFDLDMNEIRVV
ncbi:MAG: hypothetical protein R3B93_14755 [Bacteroidia bacterium]